MSEKTNVFVLNGFLESGKTSFIQEAVLRDPNIGEERVVIICCEEGEEEYEDLPDNIHLHMVEDKEELTAQLLEELDREFEPSYVIFEYNAIWEMKRLYDIAMPAHWQMMAQFTIIDAETFEGYFSNMKNFFADMLRLSTRVFVNRCTREDNFKFFRDSIKSCAPRADIIYENDEEGVLDITLEDELPYSLQSKVITLDEDSYPIWYIDMLDNVERYLNKTIEYAARVSIPEDLREGYFLAGNMVMTCCADDMQFWDFLCKYQKAYTLKEGDEIKLRGVVHHEFVPEFGEKNPVLYVTKLTILPKTEE